MTAAARFWIIIPLFGLFTAVVIAVGADARQHANQPGAGVRSADPVGRERRRADLLHRASAACARRRARWLHACRRRCRAAGTPSQSARDAVHAWRLGGRGTGRHARDRVSVGCRRARRHVGADGELCRCARRHRDRLLPGHARPRRTVDHRDSARRGDAQRVFLGHHHVRAVRDRYGGLVPDGAVAPGQPRREQLSTDPRDHATACCFPLACSRCFRGR